MRKFGFGKLITIRKLSWSNESVYVATRTIQCAKIYNKNIETKGMEQTNK